MINLQLGNIQPKISMEEQQPEMVDVDFFEVVDDLTELNCVFEEINTMLEESKQLSMAVRRHQNLKKVFEEKGCSAALIDLISMDYAKAGIYIPELEEDGSNHEEVKTFCIESTEGIVASGLIKVQNFIKRILIRIMEWIDRFLQRTSKNKKRIQKYLEGPLASPGDLDSSKFENQLDVYTEKRYSDTLNILSSIISSIARVGHDIQDLNLDTTQRDLKDKLAALGYDEEAYKDTSKDVDALIPKPLTTLGWDPNTLQANMQTLFHLLEAGEVLEEIQKKFKQFRKSLDKSDPNMKEETLSELKNDLDYLLRVMSIWMRTITKLTTQGLRICSKVT